jgi:hypothetical protein
MDEEQYVTHLLGKRLKHRPRQSNRNRIVLAHPPKKAAKARCVSSSSVLTHNLRNDSPKGTRVPRLLLADIHRVKGPDFLMPIADVKSRQTLAGRPFITTKQRNEAMVHIHESHQVEDFSEFIMSRKKTPF